MIYIPTAQYGFDPSGKKSKGEQRRRARYDAKQKLQLISDFFSASESHIMELDSPSITSERDISSVLDKSQIVYVDGGNTFYLQYHMLRSGFWPALRQHFTTMENCIYIGASAGAIVAGNSIETAYWKGWDDPNVVGNDFEWTQERKRGAGLVMDESFFMHYDEASHAEMVQQQAQRFKDEFTVRVVPNHAALIYAEEDGTKVLDKTGKVSCRYKLESIYENNLLQS